MAHCTAEHCWQAQTAELAVVATRLRNSQTVKLAALPELMPLQTPKFHFECLQEPYQYQYFAVMEWCPNQSQTMLKAATALPPVHASPLLKVTGDRAWEVEPVNVGSLASHVAVLPEVAGSHCRSLTLFSVTCG